MNIEELSPDVFDEIEKEVLYLDQRAHGIPDLAKAEAKKFENGPEGKEVAVLRDAITNYIDNKDNFEQFFISPVAEAKCTAERLIDTLEHPPAGESADPKLAKEIKALLEDVKKRGANDFSKKHHFTKIHEEALKIGVPQDIDSFLHVFNYLLNSVHGIDDNRFKDTPVAKAIAANSAKITPAIIKIRNYQALLSIWKMLLSKLYLPNQINEAKKILGDYNQDVAFEIIRRLGNVSVVQLKDQLDYCFPRQFEDENMTNLLALAKKVAAEGHKNIFAKALAAAGAEDQAEAFTNSFKDERSDPKTAEHIAERVRVIRGNVGKFESEAKQEFAGLIKKMLDEDAKEVEAARHKFHKTIKERADEIVEKHNKNLAALIRGGESAQRQEKNVLSAIAVLRDSANEIEMIGHSVEEHYTRAQEILAILSASISLTQFLKLGRQADQFNQDMEKLRMRMPTAIVSKEIDKIKALASIVGKVPPDQFAAYLKRQYDTINLFGSQIIIICEKTPKLLDMMEHVKSAHYAARQALGSRMSIADREAREYDRRIERMGIDFERYEHELPPEDAELLEFYRHAA